MKWLIISWIVIRYGMAVNWVRIEREPVIWEDLEVSDQNERRLYCGEFDDTYSGDYVWRFNGGQTLPQGTQIHKNVFTFLSGANAIRNQLPGEYECCVRETLGNACYSRNLIVKNLSENRNIDIANTTSFIGVEGDTYYIKMLDVKRIESIKCNMDGNYIENFKYPPIEKSTKKSVRYHLKIENLAQPGTVNCSIRIHRKEVVEKSFQIFIGNPTDPTSTVTRCYSSPTIILTLFLAFFMF